MPAREPLGVSNSAARPAGCPGPTCHAAPLKTRSRQRQRERRNHGLCGKGHKAGTLAPVRRRGHGIMGKEKTYQKTGGAREPGQRVGNRRVQEVDGRAQGGHAGHQRHAQQARLRRAVLRRQGRRRGHRAGRLRFNASPGRRLARRQDFAEGGTLGRGALVRGQVLHPGRVLRLRGPVFSRRPLLHPSGDVQPAHDAAAVQGCHARPHPS